MWDTYHVRILEGLRVRLVSLLDLTSTGLLDALKERGVLGTTQHENLQAENINQQRASKLVSILLKKSSEHFKIFLECLREYDHAHVAEMLGFGRPAVYLISPPGNEEELGIQAILEEMKTTIMLVDKSIDVRILTPAEMKKIQTHQHKKIIAVLPDTANAAFEFSETPEKQMCGVVAVPLSSQRGRDRRAILRFINQLALTCFLSVDVFEDWKHHLHSALHHTRMVYIPFSVSTHEKYFVTPKFEVPIRIVVDLQTMDSLPVCFETILRVLEELNIQGDTKLNLYVLLSPSTLRMKEHIFQKATGRNIELECVECIDKSKINNMKENSVWLFPGGDKYLTWTSLRPTVHGIPHIITKDSQVFQIHQCAEGGLKDGLIWENTSDTNASVRNLKECLSSILNDQANAFDKARCFSKWFMCFKYVIKSTSQFLQYALDSNLTQVVIRVHDFLDQNARVVADSLLSGQVAGDDSPLHTLVREAWSKHMEDTVLVAVENGSILLHIYVADIESWVLLQKHFRNGHVGEAMLDMIVILWRSSFAEKSINEVKLELELIPPLPLRSIFKVERRETSMVTSAKDGRGLFCRAAAAGASDAVSYLIDQHPPTADQPGYLPLIEACKAGHLTIVKLLLDRYPVLVKSCGEHALSQAQKAGKDKIVQFLEMKKTINRRRKVKLDCSVS